MGRTWLNRPSTDRSVEVVFVGHVVVHTARKFIEVIDVAALNVEGAGAEVSTAVGGHIIVRRDCKQPLGNVVLCHRVSNLGGINDALCRQRGIRLVERIVQEKARDVWINRSTRAGMREVSCEHFRREGAESKAVAAQFASAP